jgi:Extensin-like protein C-terminus
MNPKSEFVKKIHDDACGTFETVLGPEANEAQKEPFSSRHEGATFSLLPMNAAGFQAEWCKAA